jgi:hypothetical protein
VVPGREGGRRPRDACVAGREMRALLSAAA